MGRCRVPGLCWCWCWLGLGWCWLADQVIGFDYRVPLLRPSAADALFDMFLNLFGCSIKGIWCTPLQRNAPPGLFYPTHSLTLPATPLQRNAHFCLFLKSEPRISGDPPWLNPGFLL